MQSQSNTQYSIWVWPSLCTNWANSSEWKWGPWLTAPPGVVWQWAFLCFFYLKPRPVFTVTACRHGRRLLKLGVTNSWKFIQKCSKWWNASGRLRYQSNNCNIYSYLMRLLLLGLQLNVGYSMIWIYKETLCLQRWKKAQHKHIAPSHTHEIWHQEGKCNIRMSTAGCSCMNIAISGENTDLCIPSLNVTLLYPN